MAKVIRSAEEEAEYATQYPFWDCPCKLTVYRMGQSAAFCKPYHCRTCDRVYDGRNWFISLEWYNLIVTWEDFAHEVGAVLLEEPMDGVDEQTEQWAIEVMDFCDRKTRLDASVFWRLWVALVAQRPPMDEEHRDKLHQAVRACDPHVQLFWKRAESFPWRAEEWENAAGDAMDAEMVLRTRRARYTPPPCPKCTAKTYVDKTKEQVRYLVCRGCDHRWLEAIK
ncbi:MAG: hypothetical protein H0T51_23680 [Pirellulales bacterium]|nr:hypothetical protein [Pirellulales bacterium]